MSHLHMFSKEKKVPNKVEREREEGGVVPLVMACKNLLLLYLVFVHGCPSSPFISKLQGLIYNFHGFYFNIIFSSIDSKKKEKEIFHALWLSYLLGIGLTYIKSYF